MLQKEEENLNSKEFYGKIDSDFDFSLFNNSINNNEIPFKSKIPPILKTNYNNVHYLCPKCHFFPFIQFINLDEIYYTCGCRNLNNKEKNEKNGKESVKIENLFISENKYMTFLDNNDKKNLA